MKIAHLVGHGALNGVATSSRILIQAQLDAGHEVMLVHSLGSWIEHQKFEGPIQMMGSGFATTPKEIRRVGYAIRDWGEDVVHCHGSRGNKFGLVFRCAAGTPIVMTAHARQYQLPWLFAHEVIGLSQWTVDYYIRHWLVSRRHIHLLPNMFDVSRIEPVSAASRSQARAALGIRDDAFLIGSVGQLGGRKNQIDMVRVLRRLLDNGVDAELLVVGSTQQGNDIMAEWDGAIAAPEVEGRIHLPGLRSDALDLLPAFDVFLMTSRDEQAPIAPLEAMAAVLPVLSTRVGNMVDLLPAGQTFEVGDVAGMAEAALELRDEARRQAVGQAGRQEIARQLDPQRIVGEIDKIYRLAIDRSSKKRRQK
ncbi:glycosyltransferase involved in cell wall biosynthesis [Aminobacter lissarensis]|uniref:Glycosyltransferase involved in cell wall biosynthesis n=1 Tax=Aminobacter carboxidus TaxID=376165 RepID=A0A8E1W951_9HYPH|nr:glycosyltransferase family 4 protein [Aminobacter lissarensis]MBB6464281.1 glycosyltransferase involved in cell wall biosynthesis [Aminobacter lissarensis]